MNSLDWQNAYSELQKGIASVSSYTSRRDLFRMLLNIDGMVSELSKAELTARRSPSKGLVHREVDKQLERVNEEINNFEKYVTLALLLKDK